MARYQSYLVLASQVKPSFPLQKVIGAKCGRRPHFSLVPLDGAHIFTDVPPPSTLSGLRRPELEALVVELSGEVADLKQIFSEQREEIARLKGLKGRPVIKPSGMDKGTEPAKPAKKEAQRRRGKVRLRVSIEERVVKAAAVPEGPRFKGHEPFLVQDLVWCRTW